MRWQQCQSERLLTTSRCGCKKKVYRDVCVNSPKFICILLVCLPHFLHVLIIINDPNFRKLFDPFEHLLS